MIIFDFFSPVEYARWTDGYPILQLIGENIYLIDVTYYDLGRYNYVRWEKNSNRCSGIPALEFVYIVRLNYNR